MSGNMPPEETSPGVSIPGPTTVETTTGPGLTVLQSNPAARSARATTFGSTAVNEDSANMPELPDRRHSIRAEALVNTKDPRELTGIRHQQDPGHEQHHRDRDGAHTPATHLLGRDGTQPAPTPRRNVSEAGVSDVLLRPDQPHCTSSILKFTRSRKPEICPLRTTKILVQISPMARRSQLLAH